jgi:hypothetical protein
MSALRKIALLLVGLLAIAGVVQPYDRLSMTADDSYHIDYGLQWWRTGKYTKEPLHPPLSRVAMSAPIYLGEQYFGLKEALKKKAPSERYISRVVLMRAAMLPFYILSLFVVFLWSRSLFGYAAGIWSLALYGTLSAVSANAGLLATDMTYATTFLLALFMGVRWLEQPDMKRSVMLGLSLGLMLCSKFSSLVHWPVAMGAIMAFQLWHNWRMHKPLLPFGIEHVTRGIKLFLPLLILVTGLIYRFDYYQFYAGIEQVVSKNNSGHAIWLFEELPKHGVWYFFPVVFFFKTPLAFHLFWIAGLLLVCMRGAFATRPQTLFPVLAALAVMASSMTSNINLGVRHVLPVYPLLAIVAGYALHTLWKNGKYWRLSAFILLCWQVHDFWRHAPDHVSYFNEAAGQEPVRISPDSDFDWAQGTILVREEMLKLGIHDFYFCGRRTAVRDAKQLFAPELRYKSCKPPTSQYLRVHPVPSPSGWVVVSKTQRLTSKQNFTWLVSRKALHHIGRIWEVHYIREPYAYKVDYTSAHITRSLLCADPAFRLFQGASASWSESWQAVCDKRQDLLSRIRPEL